MDVFMLLQGIALAAQHPIKTAVALLFLAFPLFIALFIARFVPMGNAILAGLAIVIVGLAIFGLVFLWVKGLSLLYRHRQGSRHDEQIVERPRAHRRN